MDRLKTIATALLVLVVSTATAQVIYKPIAKDPLKIDGGLVSGTHLPSGVKAYFGIPFAAAPVRNLRWRDPQPVPAWPGVYTADRMQPECVQSLRSSDIDHYFGEESASEDCLYLNLWAPTNAKTGAKLPVVVFIYGGSFTGGSSGMALYGGEQLARKGVIYVNFNYRLGVFGYLAHPALTAESPNHASGDFGLLDQVAALKWVQRNIATFGGDPKNVMLIGQSAGAWSLNDLQASPLAKGLFRKVFAMSGSTINGFEHGNLTGAEAQGEKLQVALRAASIADMRAAASDKVVAAAQTAGVRPQPIIDGYFMPKAPAAVFAAHEQSDVPLVLGSTSEDNGTSVPVRSATDVASYRAAASQMYGDKASEFLAVFPATNDSEAIVSGKLAGQGSGFARATRSWAKAQAVSGKEPVWLYLFSHPQSYKSGVVIAGHDPTRVGAFHTDDVAYWLQTLDSYNLIRETRSWTAYDRELADKMSNVVVAFARSDNPSTSAVPMAKYDPSDIRLTEFGEIVRAVSLNTKAETFLEENAPKEAPRGGGRGGRGPTTAPNDAVGPRPVAD